MSTTKIQPCRLRQEVETDDVRVKWVQRGCGVFDLIALMCMIAQQYASIFAALAFYLSWYIVLQKRLVRYCETIVARNERGYNHYTHQTHPLDPIHVVVGICSFLFLDAVILKSLCC